MSEAGELPVPEDEDESASAGGVEQPGGDQDSEPAASAQEVEEDSERDQAEG